MAPINKYIQATNDPTYLGYSKGPEDVKPNLALGKLFHGIGTTFEEGIKGGTDLLDIKIEQESQKKVNAMNNETIGGLSMEDAATLGKLKNKVDSGSAGGLSPTEGARIGQGSSQVSSSEEGATLLPETTQNAPVTPVAVREGMSKLDQLYSRYQSGQLSPTYLLMQEQVIAQQLKQRYPGSEKEIDSVLHRQTAPANAIRSQIFADFQAAAAAGNSANKDWEHYVRGAAAPYLGKAGVDAALRPEVYADKSKQAAVIASVAEQEKSIKDGQVRHAQMTNEILSGNLDTQKAERNLTLDLQGMITRGAAGALSPLVDLQKKVDTAAASGKFSEEDILAWKSQATEMRRAIDDAFTTHINNTNLPGGQSYSSLIRDPAKVAALRKQAMEPLDHVDAALGLKDLSLASWHLDHAKRMVEMDTSKIFETSNLARWMAALKPVGDQNLVSNILTRPENRVPYTDPKTGKTTEIPAMTRFWKDILELSTGNAASGGKVNGNNLSELTQPKTPQGNPPAQVVNQGLINLKKMITSPDASSELKSNVLDYMIKDSNGDFFKNLDRPSQLQAFNILTSPDVSQSVLSLNDPKKYSDYKDWATRIYTSTSSSRRGEVKVIADAKGFNLQYDPKLNQLTYDPQPKEYSVGSTKTINYPELQTIIQLNSGLKNLDTIYKQDKTQASDRLIPLFQGMGVPIKVEGTGKRSEEGSSSSVQRMSYSPEGLGLSQEQQASVIGVANKAKPGLEWGVPGSPGFVTNNLTNVQTTSGQSVKVNQISAQAFQGFLNDLEATGYKIKDIGGYSLRNKKGGGGLSQHAFGNAIDINPDQNPYSRKFITDLPDNVSSLAAKWGLSWGGDWKSIKDTMHFEYTGVKQQRRAFEDIDNKDTSILDKLRTDLKINPQAWDAWLAQGPWSSNIEDRRGETPESALAQEMLRKMGKIK